MFALGSDAGGWPTLIVFSTNDSSKIAILAATNKSCWPRYSQPKVSTSPCSWVPSYSGSSVNPTDAVYGTLLLVSNNWVVAK